MKFPPEWTKSPNIKRKRTRDNRASRLKIGLSYSERNEVTKFLRRNYIKDADTRYEDLALTYKLRVINAHSTRY